MKRNKLKKIIKKVLKEQATIRDIKPPPKGPPPSPNPGDGTGGIGGGIPSRPIKDKGAHAGKVNLGVWKVISATPNYSGLTPQNMYSTTCPPKKTIGPNLIKKNRFKAISRKKYKRKRN